MLDVEEKTKRKTEGLVGSCLVTALLVAHLHPCHAVLGVVSQVSKVWVKEGYGERRMQKQMLLVSAMSFVNLERTPFARFANLSWQRYVWQGRIQSSARAS